MIRIVVNGQPMEVDPGSTILAALARAHIHVPQLCHDPRLAPVGACRLCIVDVAGEGRPVAACIARATDGMVIETHTPALEQERRMVLELQAWNHPAEAKQDPVGNRFLDELRAYGLDGELRGRRSAELVDDSNPYIRIDMSRCITCYRCERICREVQGQCTWRIWNRGDQTRLRPDSGTTLRESSCVSCGACVDSCPSGALEDKTILAFGPAEAWTRTTCPYCGVGCEMNVGVRQGRLTQVRPVLDAPVNKGHLCVKGRYAFEFVHAADRVTVPMIRDRDDWRTVSWAEALAFVAAGLDRIGRAHGPDAIGVLGSARATNEDNYVTQKLARVAIGTNNVDCCARVCHAPSAAALNAMLGAGAATNSFDDIERASTLFVFGSNATENHPIVGARIRQAALRGARLIVADPRRIELAEIADVFLQLRPGTNVPLLCAMAWTILDEGLVDDGFVATRVSELDEFRQFVAAWPAARAAAECGVDAELIRRAARIYATDKPAMCVHGLGATEHVQGTDAVMCLINLALLTGNLGIAGAGINPLRGQNNVQGSAHMGCEPHHLTGYATIDGGRARFENLWRAPVPRAPGLNLMEMIEAAGDGRLKALYAIGYDVLLTNPNANRTREALSRLDLVIVQDMFLSETARESGHVFLPTASAFEKDGTFMNGERRIQRVRRVIAPPGVARADWEIVCALADAMGHRDGFRFQSAEQIWDEVRSLWPGGAGITYERLDRGGLQWPCPSEDHPGTAMLHVDEFASGPRAALRRIEYRPSPEAAGPDYPLVLVTGRRLYQFNAGTMTGRTPNLELQPADVLDVSPQDADGYGLSEGNRVLVRSRYGEAALSIRIASGMRQGEVFATFHTAEIFLNRVTSPHCDGVTGTPEYKATAVQLRRL